MALRYPPDLAEDIELLYRGSFSRGGSPGSCIAIEEEGELYNVSANGWPIAAGLTRGDLPTFVMDGWSAVSSRTSGPV